MASSKINLNKITGKLSGIKNIFIKYLSVIFIVMLVGMYSFLVFRINSLVSVEPSEEAVNEKLQTVQRPKIDQSAVTKIKQLQDNSVNVQTLFKEARDNPFQE